MQKKYFEKISFFNMDENDLPEQLDKIVNFSDKYFEEDYQKQIGKIYAITNEEMTREFVHAQYHSYSGFNDEITPNNVYIKLVGDNFITKFNQFLEYNLNYVGLDMTFCNIGYIASNVILKGAESELNLEIRVPDEYKYKSINNFEDEYELTHLLSDIAPALIIDKLKPILVDSSVLLNRDEKDGYFYNGNMLNLKEFEGKNSDKILNHFLACQFENFISNIFESKEVQVAYKNVFKPEQLDAIKQSLINNAKENKNNIQFDLGYTVEDEPEKITEVTMDIMGVNFRFESADEIKQFIANPNELGKFVLENQNVSNEKKVIKKNKP